MQASLLWEADGVARVLASERRAWLVASVAVLGLFAALAALAGLTPLKTVEPFVIRVDKHSGYADVVTRLSDQRVSFDEAMDKYWLAQYVEAREEYSDKLFGAFYDRVGLMSTPDVGQAYFEKVRLENPKSPVKVYGTYGSVEVEVSTTAFLSRGVASVRFVRRERPRGAEGDERVSRWLATVTYTYGNPPLTEKERQINPLGFTVSDYRVDSEVTSTSGSAP
jgi:type IV secretion system protein VirB8